MRRPFQPDDWFKELHSANAGNALYGLNASGRKLLAACLYIATAGNFLKQSGLSAPATSFRDLVKGKRSQAAAYEKARVWWPILDVVDPDHRAKADRLTADVALYESLEDAFPKEGHEVRGFSNLLLDLALEFVRIRLGSYCYGDIQELMAVMDPSTAVLEADALRKRVERFRKDYSQLHKVVLEMASRR